MQAPSKEWIHPTVVIRLFANTVSRAVGDISQFSDFLKNREIKVTAEAWCAAMYLVALSRLHGDPYIYMQHNPNDPPDFFGLHFKELGGSVRGHELEIEVFQIPDESPLSVYEEIGKKTSKAYSAKTVLVCLLRKSSFRSTLDEVHECVKKLEPTNEVWVISGGLTGRLSDHLVAEVFPHLIYISVDTDDVMKTQIDCPFIVAKRGRQSNLTFEHIGYKRLDSDFTLHDVEE